METDFFLNKTTWIFFFKFSFPNVAFEFVRALKIQDGQALPTMILNPRQRLPEHCHRPSLFEGLPGARGGAFGVTWD